MNNHSNRAERRGQHEAAEPLEPAPFIYSKDPWDERRFNPFARRLRSGMSAWKAAAPFLLILGTLALLLLAIFLVKAIAR